MPNRSSLRLRRTSLLAPVGLLALGACNLDVTTPDVVPAASTQGTAALPTRLAGAVGDFALAYSGYEDSNNGDGLALISGLMADEFIATDQFDTHYQLDTRSVLPSNNTNGNVLRNVMRSVRSSQETADAYAAAGQQNALGRAQALNLVGFDYILVAENYCSGMPFSSIGADGSFNYGSPLSTNQMLDTAIARFDEATTVATAANNSRELNAARVGKARAQLDRGLFAAAAATAASVPADFEYATEQGTTNSREKSGIYVLTWESTRYTTADEEGGNGLPFVSSGDPRTETDASLGASGFDNGTPLNAPLKYSDYTSPTMIASGTEATLIRAEAALQAGNYAGAGGTLALLNGLRSGAGLDPLTAVAGREAQVRQLFSERAFWLYGTAHRLGDLRRLVRQYGLGSETVYPTGAYFKGGSYGQQLSLPAAQEESANPNFSAGACDPLKP